MNSQNFITAKSKREIVYTKRLLGEGGEGLVFQADAETAGKIYHDYDHEKILKILYLINNRRRYMRGCSKGALFAWPTDLLVREGEKNPCGCTMELIENSENLQEIITNHQDYVEITFQDFIYLLSNVAYVVKAAHKNDIVMGDLTPNNFQVYLNTLEAVGIDVESYQYKTDSGLFTCGVGVPKYLAPEILRSGDLQAERSIFSDYHSLAAIIFEGFTGGIHFAQGKIEMPGDNKPDVITRACNGWWTYSSPKVSSRRGCPGKISPIARAVDWRIFGDEIQRLFNLAFDEGYDRPEMRPTPEMWISALRNYADRLIPCNLGTHLRLPETVLCPWCQLAHRIGYDRWAVAA